MPFDYKVFLFKRDSVVAETGEFVYNAIALYETPPGVNAALINWSEVLVHAKINKTSLVVGSAPGNITQAEKDAVAAGTKIEVAFKWMLMPNWTSVARMANLHTRAREAVNDHWYKKIVDEYNYYGLEQEFSD